MAFVDYKTLMPAATDTAQGVANTEANWRALGNGNQRGLQRRAKAVGSGQPGLSIIELNPYYVKPAGPDVRVKPDPASGPPNGINWQAPITLLSSMAGSDGIIRPTGHYRSTDVNTPAVTCNCGKTPVDPSGMKILHAGTGIQGGTDTNLIGKDISLYGIDTTVTGAPRKRAINLFKPYNFDLQYVTVETSGGIYIDHWNGDHSAASSFKLQNLRMRNVIGTDGKGSGGAADLRHTVQLSNVRTKGMLLKWLETFNEPGKSRTEDTVNLYNSGGLDENNDLLGQYFYLHGAYPFQYDNTFFTGAQLSADGSGNAGDNQSSNILIQDAYLVSACNAAANIATGHNIRYDRIWAVSSGLLPPDALLPNGGATKSGYAGAWIGDYYGLGAGAGNAITNLTIAFMRTKDTVKRNDLSNGGSPGIDLATLSQLRDATLEAEAFVFELWRDLKNQLGATCGSRL